MNTLLSSSNPDLLKDRLLPFRKLDHIYVQEYLSTGVSINLIYIFKHDDSVNVSGFIPLYKYMDEPTISNAKELLIAAGIPEPLYELVNLLNKRRISVVELEPVRPTLKRHRNSGGAPTNTKIKNIASLDILHDLTTTVPLANSLWNRIELPSNTKDQLKREFQTGSTSFTRNCYKAICGIDTISETFHQDNSSYNITRDSELYKQLCRLVTDSTMNVVIDGVLDLNISNTSLTIFTRTIVACAIFEVLLYNSIRINKLNGFKTLKLPLFPKTLKTINIMDGVFNKIDGLFLSPFYYKYLLNLSKIKDGIVCTLITPLDMEPIYYKKYYRQDVNIDDQTIVVGKYVRKVHKNPPTKSQLSLMLMNKRDSAAQDIADYNFLRDAYRVDVAIQNNAFYMTPDQLSYCYYKTIIELEKKETRGLYLSVDPMDRMHVKVQLN